jgi:NADH:ubiquinone oxidoreductase subunit 5 (subunit L)/multisubunit Na+/H+ antiporter MnhA subunit
LECCLLFGFFFNSGEMGPNYFLLVLAAITRRTQISLSSWLFAVMVVRNPVSPLLHSSTLVTAGVVPKMVGVLRFYVRMGTEPLAET